MRKKILILTIAILAVAAVGLTAFSYAAAAGPNLPTWRGSGPGPVFGHQTGERGDGPLRPYIEEASAEILGIPVEELREALADGVRPLELIDEAGLTVEEFHAALEAALPDIVAQALEDGAITGEQAEQILENGLWRHPHRFGPLDPYVLEATAEILGMDIDELQAALENGTPMADLLDEADLTHLEFRMALDEATPGIVRAALADEVITEEQAERILQYGLPTGPCGPGGRGPGGHRGPGGPGVGPMGPGGMNGPGGQNGFSGPNG